MSEDDGQDGITERVAAIVAADAVGYTRLMADDEKATIAALDRARAVFAEHIKGNHGRVVDTAGDSVLAVFETTGGAVRASVAIQEGLAALNADVPVPRQMQFRIGIHLGDIHEKADGTVYGDGVNVAARLEALSEPGEVTISDAVRGSIRDRLDVGFADLGEHEGKNLSEPVRAYRLLPSGVEVAPVSAGSRGRGPAIAAVVAAVVLIAGVAWWQMQEAEPPQMVTAEGAATDDPVLAMPTGPSIAVLPFENLSGDPEHDYFADGISEDILTQLSRFSGIKVIARNSSFQLRGQALDVQEVGQKLGAQYVLEGSVRRAGDQLRVTVQLLDTEDGAQVWAEAYDRDVDVAALFDVQDAITSEIAGILAGATGVIARSEIELIKRKAPGSLDSYECVLLGHRYQLDPTEVSHVAARDCLEAAVESDPDYAEAWAWLAFLYVEEAMWGFNARPDGPDALTRAEEAAKRALEEDRRNQRAHVALAGVHYARRDIAGFVSEAEQALAINPNDADVLGEMAWRFAYGVDWERGLSMMEKAKALNPLYPGWYNLASFFDYYGRGLDQQALEAARKAAVDHYISYYVLAAVYGQLGRKEEAAAAIDSLLALYPDFRDHAREELEAVLLSDPDYVDRMLEGLEKAGLFDEPEAPSRPVIAVLPFDNLSGDPEQEYFADGITEDIITRLAQYPDILVLGRNTTFQFKGEAVDIPTIAEKLGADYVVEGSIRRGGDTVRVTAQLLGGDEWGHVWAETYDRAHDPGNLFAIQDEITSAIASRIGDYYGAIGEAEFQRSVRRAPDHLSSYECVLRFFEYGRVLSPDTHRAAIDCLEAVVEAEPDYAEAMAFLGEIYLDDVAFGFGASPDSSLQRALELTQRAVAIESDNGSALIRLARAYYLNGDVERAYRATEKSLRLEPNSVDVIAVASDIFVRIGRFERGFEMLELVQELNPNYPPWMNWDIAIVNMARGEYTEAIARLEQTQMDWQYWTPAFIAAAHCQNGDIESGRKSLETALQLNPDLAEVYWREFYFWNKGPDVRPMVDAVGSGLEACGWEVPPDPGPEAFAAPQ